MRIIDTLIVALVLLLPKESNNSRLVLLSDRMISNTEKEHRVSRKVARWHTWERDVFIHDLPEWVVDGEQILIIEQRYSFLNPSVYFFAIDSDSEGIYSREVPYLEHANSKKRYEKIVQEGMQEYSPGTEKAEALRHLAEVAFSNMDPSSLDALFEPNRLLDVFPSYYVWSIRHVDGKFYTQYYRYVGECLVSPPEN